MRKSLFIGFGLAAALASHPALAQDFGEAGDVSFAADRLTGIYLFDNDGGGDLTLVSLGASPAPITHPYMTTRLGIDFFVIDQLSLGGSLALWFYNDNDGGPGDNDMTNFMIYPRIGYAINFSDSFGFWPRGGITFTNFDEDWFIADNDEVALSFEATFYAIPVEHFGFNFGPTIDIGVAGDNDEALSFGIVAAGLFGWL